MCRNAVAWFGVLGQVPGPLCLCTSVNAAAQLVGAGIGVFPSRMVESYRIACTIVPIKVNPPLPAGYVYVAHRLGSDQYRTEAAVSVIERITRTLDYFKPQRQVPDQAKLPNPLPW